MIYLILLFILLLLSCTKPAKGLTSPIVYYGIMMVMAFIAGGRGIDVGVDTSTYLSIYNDIGKIGYMLYLEPGWNALNIFAHWLGLSFNGLLFMTAVIMLLPIFYLSKKLSYNPYFPIFIYFALHVYDASFNAMRQYTSLSYVLLAYYFYTRKSWIKLVLSLIFAISLHKSNLLVVPVLIGLGWFSCSNTKKVFSYLILSFLIGCLVNDSFFSLILMDYSHYIDSGLYRDSSLLATIFSLLVSVFSFMLFTLIPKEKRNLLWCKLYIISLIVLLLTFRLEYGARIYVLFSISQLFFIPYLIKVQRRVKDTSLKVILYSYYVVIYMRMWLLNANDIMPYTNVWI